MRILLSMVGWVVGIAILVATVAAIAAIGAPILLVLLGLGFAVKVF